MSPQTASPTAPDSGRPIVLTFLRHYLPGFRHGGPIRSIANLVQAIGDEFNFLIVTLNRDFGATAAYSDIVAGCWLAMGSARVLYLEPKQLGIWHISKIARETPHDLLYLNSFFDPRFTQQLLLARRLHLIPRRPLLIAPRGELSEGAVHIKRFRKRMLIAAGRVFRMYKDATWQATSDDEAADIRRRVVHDADGRVVVASNIPTNLGSELHAHDRIPRPDGAPLRVCFLSRITIKKNLDYAFRVLSLVNQPVHFTIYGPIADAHYWSECTELMEALPSNIAVVYAGELEHTQVHAALQRHDVFFLPTRNENFGHVILEALRAGLVVLISDQTRWRDLEQHGVGWALPLAFPERFARALEELASWDRERFENDRLSANVYAARANNLRNTLEATRSMFRNAIYRPQGITSAS